ncbi:MAG: aldo/keto reductase, partial [Candidatus Brocadiaceae bacterium]
MAGKRKLLLIIPVLVVAGVLGYRSLLQGTPEEPGVVRVSGNIEITDAEVSFRVPGHVAARLVSEGQTVEAGQAVACLDTSDLEREVQLRQGEVAGARASLAELEAGSRPQEIAEARAAVEQAEARLEELTEGSRPQEIEPAEVAAAFDELHASGKVRYFGVSNWGAPQIEVLLAHLDRPLVANQVQISLAHPKM